MSLGERRAGWPSLQPSASNLCNSSILKAAGLQESREAFLGLPRDQEGFQGPLGLEDSPHRLPPELRPLQLLGREPRESYSEPSFRRPPRGPVLPQMITWASRGKAALKPDSRHVHIPIPLHPLPSAPGPLEAGDIWVVPPPVESARMPVTQAGPENSLGHGTPHWGCPRRLLGGSFGVEFERWATLNPRREKLWILGRHRPEFQDCGCSRFPGGPGTLLCGMGTGGLPRRVG